MFGKLVESEAWHDNISVIFVKAHRCVGGLKKKVPLRSGSQRHRHFIVFFKVSVKWFVCIKGPGVPIRFCFWVQQRDFIISFVFYDKTLHTFTLILMKSFINHGQTVSAKPISEISKIFTYFELASIRPRSQRRQFETQKAASSNPTGNIYFHFEFFCWLPVP